MDLSFRNNVSHRSAPYLAESFRAILDKLFAKGPWHDAFSERVHYHRFFLDV